MSTLLAATSGDVTKAGKAIGLALGVGLGNGMKGTGRGPFESGIVRIGRSGRISVYTGAMPMGQGIKTALAQICAEQFDVAPEMVTVVAGDTAVTPFNFVGTGGSRAARKWSLTWLVWLQDHLLTYGFFV